MEIKLTHNKLGRLKREYALLYETRVWDAKELAKYTYSDQSHALRIIEIDAQTKAIHDALLILGLNIWYDHNTGKAHITDMDGNEVEGE